MKFLEKNYKKIIFFTSTLFLIISLVNANNDSATFDEVAHIPAGYSYLKEHDIRLNPEHPPLIKSLSAVPLIFMDLKFDTSQDFWTGNLQNKWNEGQWKAGRYFLYDSGNDFNKIIFWSRVPMVILSVILGLFLFKWGKEYFGIVGGLMLFFLYSFNPNILGHNHYVTTDLGIAAFITFSFYYFIKFIKNPSWKNTFFAGLFLGLLLVTKFSSITVIPIYVFFITIYPLFKKIRNKFGKDVSGIKERLPIFGEYIGKSIIAFLISMLIVYGIYSLNTYRMPENVMKETTNYFFPTSDPKIKVIYTNKVLNLLNESEITRPLAAYLFGPAWMIWRVSGGNNLYFLGQNGNGFVWYFPVVFLIKETLPFLILLFISVLYGILKFIRGFNSSDEKNENFVSFIKKSLERLRSYATLNITTCSILMFVLMYSFLSIKGGLNIGFRHLFPIIPFLYILVTKKILDIHKDIKSHSKKLFFLIITILILWVGLESTLAYPNYVSYFNQIAGGPKNGYNYVTDSNADWGQDLKRLDRWIKNYNSNKDKISCKFIEYNYTRDCSPINKIRVNYFGGGDIYKTIGQEKSILWWDSKRPIENGWYAISTNFLQESLYDTKKNSENSYAWLLKYNPVEQIGTSILVYYIDDIQEEK